MARRNKQVEGQLSFFDAIEELNAEFEGADDGEPRFRRDDGASLQSGDRDVDGRVGKRPERVADTFGGDTVRRVTERGVRSVVSSDADEDVSGRGDGTASVSAGDQPVSEVSGGVGGGSTSSDGSRPVDGGGRSAASSAADEAAVQGGSAAATRRGDGVFLDEGTGYGADTADESVSAAVHSGPGQEGAGRVLAGDPVDWSGQSLRPSGFQARLDANIAALETLQTLEAGSQYATNDQQQVLAGWSSWGALPEVFDASSQRVAADTRQYVRDLLGEDGWQQARATTLNAHYTDPQHTAAIWNALRRAGFDGGPVLEPGSGSGEFIGQAPDNAQMVGVELDQTTARISSWLYPSAQIQAHGFEHTQFAEQSFNAVVGNVPFGNFSVADSTYNAQHHSIHNYFIAKSLRHTAPGGYVAVMTSTWTMDSQRTTARREFARYGDLVGGVRLPAGAMRNSAGTDVMVDVLVFRRRKPEEEVSQASLDAWVEPGSMQMADSEGVSHVVGMSQYFATHPEQMIGELRATTDQWGNMAYHLSTDDLSTVGVQLEQRLNAVVDQAAVQQLGYAPESLNPTVVEPGLHYEVVAEADIGHVRFDQEQQQFVRYGPALEWEPIQVARNRRAESQALLGLRDLGVATIEAQSGGHGEDEAEAARERLVTAWRDYEQRYGPINRSTEVWRQPPVSQQRKLVAELERQWRGELPDDGEVSRNDVVVPEQLRNQWLQQAAQPEFVRREQPHLAFLRGEPKLGLLRAMESFDERTQTATPGALMTQNVVEYRPRPERATSTLDAIAISLDETRRIDLDRVSGLLDMDTTAAREAVLDHAFVDPESGELVSAVAYLSGDVRAKLDIARQAAENDPALSRNVAELELVVPDDISIDDVVVNPGVHWVPQHMYNDFVRDTFEVASSVRWNPAGEQWEVDSPKGGFSEHIRFQWGTAKRTPANLLAASMNYRSVVVREKDSDGTYRKNEKETTAAREKVEAIRQRFNEWVTEDPDRARQLETIYNRKFNALVSPDYSALGERMELPGLAASRTPYAYQRAAVARAVNEPSVLLDHVVGAGKTGTMVMAAQELKRTGIAHKPVMVVPNHLVEQINREYVEWYPDANVIAVPTGLTKPQRQEWMGMVAAGDWDTVILPQTVFERVEIDPVKRAEWLREQIAELESVQTGAESDDRFSVKRIEAAKKRLETQYERAREKTDPGMTFEQTGIDYLFVDEAHHYKNLARQSDLAELSCAGSQRASDLDFKLRALREQKTVSAQRAGLWTSTYQPAVATFATGTPVSNTMSEMWVMQHYLRPDLLAATDAATVTAWGQQFTTSQTSLKPRMTGDGFEQVNRINKYVNVPELMKINAAFTDTVQRDQLETRLPEVVGGDRVLIRRDPSPQVQEYIRQLSHRIDTLSADSDDNMLLITGDGRRVALDGRLVGLDADDDGGRSVAVADQILDVHERTKHRQYFTEAGTVAATRGGLQIVFLDQSTPRDGWNMYDQIKDDLIAGGMEGDRIRFIHEAETDEARDTLFQACREGEVSVLLGSTDKMGTGTNVQRRAVALHHVDCPWRPADLEQREGRIIRQGNQNEAVELYSYATDNTFDVASWDMIARKATFIGQMKRGELAGRDMEDVVAGLEFSASSAAAQLSGDPRIQELAELQLRIEQLESLRQSWQTQRSKNRVLLRHNDNRVNYLAANMPQLQGLADGVVDTSGQQFRFSPTDRHPMTERADAGAYLANVLRSQALRTDLPNYQQPSEVVPVGTLGGIDLGVLRHGKTVQLVVADMPSIRREWSVEIALDQLSATGTIRSAENMVSGLADEYAKWQQEHHELTNSRAALAEVLDAPFEHQQELDQLHTQAQDLAAEMGLDEDEADQDQAAEPISGKTLEAVFGEPRGGPSSYRENDVVSYKRSYYRIGFVDGEMFGYPPDEPRPDDLAKDGTRLFAMDTMTIIERDMDQLTAMEHTVVQRNPDYDVYYRHAFELADGDRVKFAWSDDPDTIAEATYDRPFFVLDDGTKIRTSQVDNSAGFLAVNKTSPEAKQAEAERRLAISKQRTAHQLVPGEVLRDDVEGFGYAGDIVRSFDAGYMRSVYAVSADTGQARVMELRQRPPYRPQHWDTCPPVMLSDAEKNTMFGGQQLATNIGQLRPGDRVVSTDIDDSAAVKEMVTVLDVGGDQRKNIVYRSSDDVVHSSTKMDSTAIEVHDRAKGALTGHELLRLAGHVRSVEPKNVAEFADTASVGQHVFIENDAFQPFDSAGFTGSTAATVVEVKEAEAEYLSEQIVVETTSGHQVTVSGQGWALTPLDQPVELSELVPTTGDQVEPVERVGDEVPAGATVTGGQQRPRARAESAETTEAAAQSPAAQPQREPVEQWAEHHVVFGHIGHNGPSPGLA